MALGHTRIESFHQSSPLLIAEVEPCQFAGLHDVALSDNEVQGDALGTP
jgi:hypothetical protein